MGEIPISQEVSRVFVGRTKEIDVINALYDQYIGGHALVLTMTGEPGIGKTYLVEHFFSISKSCNFVWGKNEQFSNSNLTAISQVLEQLTNYALTLQKVQLKKLQKDLQTNLRNDLSLLYKISPSVNQIINLQVQSLNTDLIKIKYRVKNVVFKYIATIAKYCLPVVVFIDDLQWADNLSFDIIKTLIKKIDQSHIMLILSYRSNESNYILGKIKLNLEEKTNFLSIQKFSYSELLAYICEVLPGKVKDVEVLAKMIDIITQGNPFYMDQLLRIFLQNEIIKRDRKTWDVAEDEMNALVASETSASLINTCIQKNYYKDQFLLDLIACFQSVDVTLINELIDLSQDETAKHIQDLIDVSILTKNETHEKITIAYSHDIISKLVYANISERKKQEIHFLIAQKIMQKRNGSEAIDDIIVAHLLKSPHEEIVLEAEKWIDVLFSTGLNKKMIALIDQARSIFELGIRILPFCKDKEKEDEVRMRLELAECYCLLDRADEALGIIDVLLSNHKKKHIVELIRIKQLYLYHYQREHRKAVELGKALLKDRGLRINKIEMVPNLLFLKHLYSKKCLAKRVEHKSITDKNVLVTLDILTLMTISATLSDDVMSNCICLKAAVYCGRFGNSPDMIVGHVSSAYILLSVWKDKKNAFALEDAIVELLKRASDKNKAFVFFILGTFFAPFSKSMTTSESYLNQSIEYGESTGDFVFLGYSILSSLDNKVFMGLHIDEMLAYIQHIRTDYSDLEQYSVTYNLQVHEAHAKVLKLGTSCFDENDINSEYRQLTDFEKLTEKGLMLQRMFLFGEIDRAFTLTEDMMKHMRLLNGMISSADIYFYMALIRISHHDDLNRKQKKRNLSYLKRILNNMKGQSSLNSGDFGALYALTSAEYETRIAKKTGTENLYYKAIDLSKNNTKIHALATLLYARVCQNGSIATYLARESVSLFTKFGAHAVAELVKEEFDLEAQGNHSERTVKLWQPMDELMAKCEKLNEQETISQLIATLIENDYADYCAFICEKAEGAIIGYESTENGLIKKHQNGLSLDKGKSVSAYISRHALRMGKDIHHHPRQAKAIYASDPYILAYPQKHISCLPILCHEAVAGLIYIEKEAQNFDDELIRRIKNFLPAIASKTTQINEVNLTHILSKKAVKTNLSIRELDVLNLMAEGYTNNRISRELNIAAGTVKNHVSSILSKFDTTSRIKAVQTARDKNLL